MWRDVCMENVGLGGWRLCDLSKLTARPRSALSVPPNLLLLLMRASYKKVGVGGGYVCWKDEQHDYR